MKQGHLQDKTAFSTEKALSISPCLNANVPNNFQTTIKDIPVIPLIAFYCLSNEHCDSSDNL